MLAPIEHRIAFELGVRPANLRNLGERLIYLRDLEERQVAVLASIEEQDKLTPELKAEI